MKIVALVVLWGGVGSLVLLFSSALGHRFELWGFRTAFGLLGIAAISSGLIMSVGLVGLIVTAVQKSAAPIPGLLVGTVTGAIAFLMLAGYAYQGRGTPPIHNISTDRVDPPMFEHAVELRGPDSNSLDYSEETAEHQARSYPDIQTLRTSLAPDESFKRVLWTAEQLNWTVVSSQAEKRVIEAIDKTFWFGFKDDIVVRIREAGNSDGSLVDVRSVSRVGLYDLGTNANRIRKFFSVYEGQQE